MDFGVSAFSISPTLPHTHKPPSTVTINKMFFLSFLFLTWPSVATLPNHYETLGMLDGNVILINVDLFCYLITELIFETFMFQRCHYCIYSSPVSFMSFYSVHLLVVFRGAS